MKKSLLFFATISLFFFTACTSRKNDSATSGEMERTETSADANPVKDSTLYGTATDDWGMSTFAVKTADGREVQLVRNHNDGTPAQIYGDLTPGNEYALTTTDNGTALAIAINLTQLKQVVRNGFKIVNGQLLLRRSNVEEPVEILKLDADSLVAKGQTTVYRFGKNKR